MLPLNRLAYPPEALPPAAETHTDHFSFSDAQATIEILSFCLLLALMKLEFPKNFYWGAATAAHQVEGDTHNDWSEWEHKNADRLARESESAFRFNPHWPAFQHEATDPHNYLSGRACEHFTRYEADFDLAQSLGHNAHRFSIEWSRIEPREGEFNQEAIEHYRSVIAALRARHIEPFVTLWHWTLPVWLAQQGGILAPRFASDFERYTKKITESLGFDVRFWITLNEPDVYSAHAYLKGSWPPQKQGLWNFWRAQRALMGAHRKAYHVIKNRFPASQVGIAKHNIWFEAAHDRPWNRLLKWVADRLWNRFFLEGIRETQDFIGLNHYNHHRINGWFNKNENIQQTDFGWEYYPESLYHAVVELIPYHKPLYILESGIADASDTLRQAFIPAALDSLHRAIAAGADVRGYFYWSLLDNFEWDKGYWLRFGLIQVDYATQARTIRPSALAYAEVCRTNSLVKI